MTSPAITPLKGILKSEKKITSRPKSYGCARECLEPGHPDAEPESLEMLEEYLGNMTLWNARDGVSNGINSPVKSSAENSAYKTASVTSTSSSSTRGRAASESMELLQEWKRVMACQEPVYDDNWRREHVHEFKDIIMKMRFIFTGETEEKDGLAEDDFDDWIVPDSELMRNVNLEDLLQKSKQTLEMLKSPSGADYRRYRYPKRSDFDYWYRMARGQDIEGNPLYQSLKEELAKPEPKREQITPTKPQKNRESFDYHKNYIQPHKDFLDENWRIYNEEVRRKEEQERRAMAIQQKKMAEEAAIRAKIAQEQAARERELAERQKAMKLAEEKEHARRESIARAAAEEAERVRRVEEDRQAEIKRKQAEAEAAAKQREEAQKTPVSQTPTTPVKPQAQQPSAFAPKAAATPLQAPTVLAQTENEFTQQARNQWKHEKDQAENVMAILKQVKKQLKDMRLYQFCRQRKAEMQKNINQMSAEIATTKTKLDNIRSVFEKLMQSRQPNSPQIDAQSLVPEDLRYKLNGQAYTIDLEIIQTLSDFSKVIITQLGGEVATNLSLAKPLGKIVGGVFCSATAWTPGPPLTNIFLARLLRVNPALFGCPGSLQETDESLSELGWLWDEDKVEPYNEYAARMEGTAAGFAGACVLNFAKSPRGTPMPMAFLWKRIACIRNIPLQMRTPVHYQILGICLQMGAWRLKVRYGYEAFRLVEELAQFCIEGADEPRLQEAVTNLTVQITELPDTFWNPSIMAQPAS